MGVVSWRSAAEWRISGFWIQGHATLSPQVLAEGPSLPVLSSVANGLHMLARETVLSYAALSERVVVWV